MHTRCPNCRAVFEITQADLDIADGVVRCGLCNVLFNASENFIDSKPKAPEPPPSERKDFEHTWNWTPEPSPQETLDFGKETIEESVENAPKVLREDIAQMYAGSSHQQKNGLYVALALLALVLVLQISAFNQFKLFPDSIYASACQWLSCPTRVQRDVGAITLLDRTVFSHPQQSDAKMFDFPA